MSLAIRLFGLLKTAKRRNVDATRQVRVDQLQADITALQAHLVVVRRGIDNHLAALQTLRTGR
jgi:hypothetical protein